MSMVGNAFEDFPQGPSMLPQTMEVRGRLPAWLKGAYVRNGPGRWRAGPQELEHLFDGYALLSRWEFDGQKNAVVWRSCRFLDSEAWRGAKSGKMRYNEFGTSVGQTPLQRAWAVAKGLVAGGITDNANVNVVLVDEKLLAFTEPSRGTYEVDATTLKTKRRFTSEGTPIQTAHPLRTNGMLINVGTSLAPFAKYTVFEIKKERRRVIATIDPATTSKEHRETRSFLGEVSWQHAFAVTKNYAILIETPAVYNIAALIGSGSADHVTMDWRPQRGTWVHVVNLKTGEVKTRKVERNIFFFHVANAFGDGDDVCVDLCVYDGPTLVNSLLLENLRSGDDAPPDSRLTRIRIPLLLDGLARLSTLDDPEVTGFFSEMPRINELRSGTALRYVYCTGMDRPTRVANTLTKTDLLAKTTVKLETAQAYGVMGEPVFVPRPGAVIEDDGCLIVVAHAPGGHTDILVIDAATMKLLATATLQPPGVPYGFHGIFIPDDSDL